MDRVAVKELKIQITIFQKCCCLPYVPIVVIQLKFLSSYEAGRDGFRSYPAGLGRVLGRLRVSETPGFGATMAAVDPMSVGPCLLCGSAC